MSLKFPKLVAQQGPITRCNQYKKREPYNSFHNNNYFPSERLQAYLPPIKHSLLRGISFQPWASHLPLRVFLLYLSNEDDHSYFHRISFSNEITVYVQESGRVIKHIGD